MALRRKAGWTLLKASPLSCTLECNGFSVSISRVRAFPFPPPPPRPIVSVEHKRSKLQFPSSLRLPTMVKIRKSPSRPCRSS